MSRLMMFLILVCPTLGIANDEIVLRDGTVIHGDLVGFEGGNYLVRIGRFQKSLPEAQVLTVRTGTTPTASSASPAPVAGAAVPSSAAPPRTLAAPAKPAAGPISPENPAGVPGDEAAAVQQLLHQGGKKPDAQQLEQLQQNPAVGKLVNRFHDRAYQESLLEGLREISDKSSSGQKNPMVDELQQLFNQLNAQEGAGAPPPAAPPASPSGE